MANVKIHKDAQGETPSQSIVKAANVEEFVTDSLGRKIGVRKLNVLERIGMLKLIGNGNSDKQIYKASVSPAFTVTSIDGDPIWKPTNDLQLTALLQRLDEEGLEAVSEWMGEMMNADQPSTKPEPDALKNE